MHSSDEARRQKEEWRLRILAELAEAEGHGALLHWGRMAAAIRGSPPYQQARHVLVPPSAPFFQVRLNALMDQKSLTVPSPGLQNGLRYFDPARTKPGDRVSAARLQKPGEALTRASYGSPLPVPVDLVLGEALCGAEDGGIIGDGRGHLDLTCALLSALHWLGGQARILAVVGSSGVPPHCPQEDHDVKAHGLITPEGFRGTTELTTPRPRIHWERLSVRQIRRNQVLFHIASRDRRVLRPEGLDE
ncbi:MAG: hypothetical protein MUF52_02830 [Syntrophobacteraceae bacterium]|nr:hypothetical protein [Syntrophobacteraceae bacterium]